VTNEINSFPNYGIESNLIEVNGVQTEQQVITKNEKFVASLDNKYQILPNEDVMEQMTEIGSKIGLVPLEATPRQWYYIQPTKSVIGNKNKYGVTTKIACILVKPDPIVMPDGKEIKLGLTVKNSIDGHWSFSASTFTFRSICQNMMFHITRQKFGSIGDYLNMENAELDNMKNHQVMQTSNVWKRHTRSLNAEVVAESLQAVFDEGENYINRYKELTQLKMNKKLGITCAMKLPKWATDHEPVKEWLNIEKDTIKVDERISQWEAFNTLTEALTHNGRKFNTTLMAYSNLDKIFA
jgi:hypothetical protein